MPQFPYPRKPADYLASIGQGFYVDEPFQPKKPLYGEVEGDIMQPSLGQFAQPGSKVGVASNADLGLIEKDPRFVNRVFGTDLQREFEDRAVRAVRAGDAREVAGLKAAMGFNQAHLDDSDIGRQQASIQADEAANQQALREGFMYDTGRGSSRTPSQLKGEYIRGQEAAKISSPERVAKAQGEADIQKQREANEGAKEVEGIRQKGQYDIANLGREQYQAIFDMLQGNPGAARDLKGVQLPGRYSGGGITLQSDSAGSNEMPAQLLTDFTNKRYLAEQAGVRNIFGNTSPAGRALEQSGLAILQRHKATPEIKEVVRGILSDPDLADVHTVEEIYKAAPDRFSRPFTTEEATSINELLSLLKGNY